MESGTASLNTDSQWNKKEACFACATQVWLAVNHNTSIATGKWVWCWSVLQVSLAAVNQILFDSWGNEQLQKFKDSLKECFKNVNIWPWCGYAREV